MSKATFISVGGVVRKVKNVWVKQGEVLEQKVIPKGLIDGVIKEFISYNTPIMVIVTSTSIESLNLNGTTIKTISESSAIGTRYIALNDKSESLLVYGENVGGIPYTKLKKFDKDLNRIVDFNFKSYSSPRSINLTSDGGFLLVDLKTDANRYICTKYSSSFLKQKDLLTGMTNLMQCLEHNQEYYLVGGDNDWMRLKKFNADLNQIGNVSVAQSVYPIDFAANDDYLYILTSSKLYKYNFDLSKVAEINISNAQRLSVDSLGNIIVALENRNLVKFDSNLNRSSLVSGTEEYIRIVEVDYKNGIYFSEDRTNYATKIKKVGSFTLTRGVSNEHPIFAVYPGEYSVFKKYWEA